MILETADANNWANLSEAEKDEIIFAYDTQERFRYARQIEDNHQQLSQGIWSCSWMAGVELEIWRMLNDPHLVLEDAFVPATDQRAWLEEIRELTIQRGRFFTYLSGDHWSIGHFVSLDECKSVGGNSHD